MTDARAAILVLGVACAVTALQGCVHVAEGRLEYAEIESRSEGRAMRYGVYSPPGWDRRTPLPLVVLLHGAADDETSADRRIVTERLDRAIVEGRVPPFLMVTPDGDRGLWMDWYDGSHRYRSWVLDEVIPAVRGRFPVIEGPAGLHLLGVSMGGGGGLQMWLADPARFASATIVSAPILDEAGTRAFLDDYMPRWVLERALGPPGSGHGADPYARLSSQASLAGGRLVFGAASRDLDAIRESNARFHEHLAAAGVPHRYVVFPGLHGWAWWAAMFEYALCHQLQRECPMTEPGDWTVQAAE